jgi:V8-like Glu-specific endopeptidase
MKATRVLFGALGCTLGAATLTLAPTASGASPTPSNSAIVTHAVSEADQAAALAHWTPARMRAARQADIAVAGAPKVSAPDATKPAGRPGSVASSLTPDAALPEAGMAPDAFSYPYPYTSFNVATANTKKYPWKINGKVFFTNNGLDYVCSGTSVVVPNGNEVWTAGHCVANTDGAGLFDSSAVFVPAYDGNAINPTPFGSFVANNFVTTTDWLTTYDLRHDEGAMTVNNVGRKTLTQKVGNGGFAWNQPVDEQFVAFGYPAAAPYNGTVMVEDIAATAVSDTGIGGAGSAPTGIGNPMTGGSSGGSWMIGWSDSGPGWINGHNDYKYPTTQPLAMYSPYFDDLSNAVRCTLQPAGC